MSKRSKNHAFSFVVIIFHCVKISSRGIRKMTEVMRLARKLVEDGLLEHNEYVELLADRDDEVREYLRSTAQGIAVSNYGHDIFLRGLI